MISTGEGGTNVGSRESGGGSAGCRGRNPLRFRMSGRSTDTSCIAA